jgi:hypothetical protein
MAVPGAAEKLGITVVLPMLDNFDELNQALFSKFRGAHADALLVVNDKENLLCRELLILAALFRTILNCRAVLLMKLQFSATYDGSELAQVLAKFVEQVIGRRAKALVFAHGLQHRGCNINSNHYEIEPRRCPRGIG